MNPCLFPVRWQWALKATLCLGGLMALSSLAQPALTPGAPALPPASVSPALSPPSPALGNPRAAAAGTVAANFSIASLAQLLAGLQTQLQQTLPVLDAFNNSFDFISVGSLTNGTGTGTAGTGANFSSSLGANFSSNAGANMSSSAAVPTLNGGSSTVLNAFGLPPGLGVAPITSQTLRSLLILQSDIERMLPSLNALNGSTNAFAGIGLTPGFMAGAVTNVFNVPLSLR